MTFTCAEADLNILTRVKDSHNENAISFWDTVYVAILYLFIIQYIKSDKNDR